MWRRLTRSSVGIAIALTTAGLFIVIALLPRSKTVDPRSLTHNDALSVVKGETFDRLREDGDGDGLADWEESLWKTSPTMPDSDGDGAQDGEEVRSGRDPSVKGPDDKLANKRIGAQGVETSFEELTETQKLGRELFAQYLTKKQGGDAFTESEIAAAVTPMVAAAVSKPALPKYSTANLSLGTSESDRAVRTYGNELGAIERRHSVKGTQNEFEILAEFAMSQQPDVLAALDAQIAQYKNFVADALLVEVPKGAAVIHLNLVNTLNDYAATLENMRVIDRDPIAVLVGLQKLALLSTRLYADFQNMAGYFKNRDVVFKEDQMGYVFTLLATLPARPPSVTP